MENSILLLLFLIGLGLILYPTVSSWIQDWNHSKAINDYRKQIEAENAAQLEQKKRKHGPITAACPQQTRKKEPSPARRIPPLVITTCSPFRM